MSTRARIVITGKSMHNNAETHIIFIASDGYPSATLNHVKEAFKKSLAQCTAHNKRFDDKYTPNPAQLCGNIIGENSDVYGMHAHVVLSAATAFSPDASLNFDFMVEWLYVIDLFKNTLKVYRGSIVGMPVDPTIYSKQLREECQAKCVKSIKADVAALKKLGLKVTK